MYFVRDKKKKRSASYLRESEVNGDRLGNVQEPSISRYSHCETVQRLEHTEREMANNDCARTFVSLKAHNIGIFGI